MKSFQCKSHAKLNLHLRITGMKPNKNHILQMLSVPVSLDDEISLTLYTSHRRPQLIMEPDYKIPIEKNLVYRAILAYWDGDLPGFKAIIKKRIPPEAGLGGGSSNAGSVLVVLNQFYHRYTEEALVSLGFRLGCDIPFFMHSHEMIVAGEGEVLEKSFFFKKGYFFLIVKPSFSFSTKAVYHTWDNIGSSFSKPIVFSENSVFQFHNDLLSASLKINPAIKMVIDDLEQTKPIGSSMTGSGSACFAMYGTENEAWNAYHRLNGKYPFVEVVRNISYD